MTSSTLSTRHRQPRSRDRRERHQVVCTDCGKTTTVPFRPTQDRPVYCRPCFMDVRDEGTPQKRQVASDHPVPTPSTRDRIAVSDVFRGMSLSDSTKEAISGMGISEPTPIQDKSVPHLLEGRDLVGQARTGSGKTLAFAVPMVEKCDPSVRRVQGLVLVPTRELAIQVAEVTRDLAYKRRIRVTLLYGGRSAKPEYDALRNGTHIVVGTPGRTLDHLRQGNLDLRSVRFMVLD
ncbi:MAG: DEAD/DEAH box helicase, partial [Dehalococcoidia bacterium]|nr:DEAD/DEAH box helicase [Dehalococcoidia bacterium]